MGVSNQPSALTIGSLLPSGLNRVAAIYTDPAKPSYDECIAKNMAAIAAGRPQDCVLFSDAAGTVPVTYPIGAGQGKGLLMDRSQGLVLGPELLSNTDNWLSTTSPAWDVSVPGVGSITAPPAQADLRPSESIGNNFVPAVIGRTYEITFDLISDGSVTIYLLSNGGTAVATQGLNRFLVTATSLLLLIRANKGRTATVSNWRVRELPGHHQQQPTAAARGEFSRRYNQLLATATLATQSITAIATNYRLYFTGAGTITLSGAATGVYSAGSHTITCTAGSLTLTVAGEVLTADLRFEADATIGLPVYQAVVTAASYDETNFPTYWRAVTDDWAKSHMNPNGATKAYVFWAGQKMSDAAIGTLLESSATSASNAGTLALVAPDAAAATTYLSRSKGTIAADALATGVAAQSRHVVSTVGDITNDVSSITVNGTTVTSTLDQGTGTYLKYDVFFGARGGTSLFANIREYAPPTILFLQPTDSLSASHITKLKNGYAKAVGVTL